MFLLSKSGPNECGSGLNPSSIISYIPASPFFLFQIRLLCFLVSLYFFCHFLMPPQRERHMRHLVRNIIFTRVHSRICDLGRDVRVVGESLEIDFEYSLFTNTL